jgi:hypothetical protein
MTSGKVIPFGYSVPSSQAILDQLMADENAYLVDIRYSVKSLNKPEWSFGQLKERYGKRYLWIKDLGNVNYFNHGPIQIANALVGIPRLVKGVEQGYTLILLCTCTRYEGCHRKVVVELLQKILPDVEVVHPSRAESSDTLPCLSIRQPWLWLITHPEVLTACNIPIKNIENRDWTTTMRGDLLLHAGSAVDPDLFHKGKLDQSYWVYKFGRDGDALYARMPQRKEDYPLGAIVVKAQLSDVVTESENPWFCGRYGWVLSSAQAFEMPIPYRGALKIFSVPTSVVKPDESVLGTQPPSTIYVDQIRTYEHTQLPYKHWCHMAVDGDIEHLHAFAHKLGLKRDWFQDNPKAPHYDLVPSKRTEAIKLGAVPVESGILLERCWPAMRGTHCQSKGDEN